MSDWMPKEQPIDDRVLDALTHQGCFAADMAALQHQGDVSSVRRPDGGPQSLTPAELTKVSLRAAIRNLLANGLIEAKSLDEIDAILGDGVTLS